MEGTQTSCVDRMTAALITFEKSLEVYQVRSKCLFLASYIVEAGMVFQRCQETVVPKQRLKLNKSAYLGLLIAICIPEAFMKHIFQLRASFLARCLFSYDAICVANWLLPKLWSHQECYMQLQLIKKRLQIPCVDMNIVIILIRIMVRYVYKVGIEADNSRDG